MIFKYWYLLNKMNNPDLTSSNSQKRKHPKKKQEEEPPKKKQQQEEEEEKKQQYQELIQKHKNKLEVYYGSRHSHNSQRIINEHANLNAYIETILRCLDELLYKLNKKVEIITNDDGSITFYITEKGLTRQELFDYRDFFKEYTGHIPKTIIAQNDATPDNERFHSNHSNKIRKLKEVDIKPQQLFISWVNGEQDGSPLMGTISLLYGMLKLKLKDPTIMFSSLEDDSNKRTAYLIFGFKHLDEEKKTEASSDLTNFPDIIDNVIQLICSKYYDYPDSCECFQKARKHFDIFQQQILGGGKRRTKKRRKSKRKKTKIRRKY